MRRLLKIFFGLVGVVLLLLIVAGVGFALFFDANDYRDTIAAQVEEQTGRELTISGEIKLSLFPWLGLKLGAMELGNARGFTGKPFARIEAAEARVKILPLLKLKTEIDTVLLRGLVLNLQRRADGVSNWDDLAKGGEAPAKTRAKRAGRAADEQKLRQLLAKLAIGGIVLEEANVEWQDEVNKQRLALNHFNFSSGEIRIGKAIPLKLTTELRSSAPEITGSLNFSGDVTAEPFAQRYSASRMQLSTALGGKGVPGGKLKVAIGGDAAVDLVAEQATFTGFSVKGMGAEVAAQLEVSKLLGQPDVRGKLTVTLGDVEQLLGLAPAGAVAPDLKLTSLNGSQLQAVLALSLGAQTLSVTPLTLSASGVELKLTAQGKQIIDNPSLSGEFSTNEFVPRQLLADLGIVLPEMADPSVMGKAKLSSGFTAGLDSVALSELSLQLDDTRFGGKASVANFAAPVIRYTLKLDEIDVDRYLPPPSEKPADEGQAVAAAPAAGEPELPLKLMRSLDIDGSFNIDKVKVMNLRSATIVTTLKAKDGKFRLHPLSARMYQGGYSGDIGLDVSDKTPRLSLDEKVSGVQAGPLFKDFMGKPLVTGEAHLQVKLTADGLAPMSVRRSLNGNGSFKFVNGTVNGVNIGQKIRELYALYKKQPKPAAQQSSTDFANLSGSFTARNGLIVTSDLKASSPVLQVDGKGNVDLGSEKIDMRLDTVLVHDEKDIAAGGSGELKGVRIPLTVKGSFSEPQFGVDFGSVLKARVDAELEKKKAEVKAEVEAKKKAVEAEAKKKLDAEKKKLEQQMQDKLKNMLKF